MFAYWQSDPGWERFNASVPKNFTVSDATKFVAEMRGRDRQVSPNWALVYQGEVSGVVSLTLEQDGRVAVIGYGVHGTLRGRGFAVEAASAVIDRAFESFAELGRLRAHTDDHNAASKRVLEKLGFKQEGTLRKNQFVKGHSVDEAVYGLLREEWVPG